MSKGLDRDFSFDRPSAFSTAFKLLSTWGPLFSHTAGEHFVYTYLLRSTLGMQRLSLKTRTKYLLYGNVKAGLMPVSAMAGLRTTIRSVNGLLKFGVFYKDVDSSSMYSSKPCRYTINIPGLRDLVASLHEVVEFFGMAGLDRAFASLSILWQGENPNRKVQPVKMRRDALMRIEEALAIGQEKYSKSKEKKAAKLKLSAKKKPVWLYERIKIACEEGGIEFNSAWTARDWGSAKNWLSYCEQIERDPNELIDLIVEHWIQMSDALLDRRGDPITLLPFFDFRQYFMHRDIINHFIFSLMATED